MSSLETAQSAVKTEIIDLLLADLRWYGKTLGGGVPMIGPTKPGTEACEHWYEVTLPLLYKLNAVYTYQELDLTADLSEARKQLATYLHDPEYLQLRSEETNG